MELLNKCNKPYFILDVETGEREPVNCLDSMRLELKKQESTHGSSDSMKIYSGIHRAEFDLKENTVIFDDSTKKPARLIESSTDLRQRPKCSLDTIKTKGDDQLEFTIVNGDTPFAKNFGEFREMWAEQIKEGDPLTTLPSMKEIIDGLYEFHCEVINQNLQSI